MRSARHGKRTSDVEVTNISAHGLWILVSDREMFLRFEDFPWFREAPVGKLLNVEMPHPNHLYWPDLDVDLTLNSIEHPDQYPLVSRSPISSAVPKAKVRKSDRA